MASCHSLICALSVVCFIVVLVRQDRFPWATRVCHFLGVTSSTMPFYLTKRVPYIKVRKRQSHRKKTRRISINVMRTSTKQRQKKINSSTRVGVLAYRARTFFGDIGAYMYTNVA